jgi:aspartate aminotransferase
VTRSKIVEVPMEETKNSWEVNFDEVRKAITPRTKVILLCSPNNPTGKVYSEKELREFCQISKENNIYLVLDEAYNYLIYKGSFISPLSFPEYADNVIVVRTFSKEFGMCGWRVGYAVVPEVMRDELFHFQLSFNSVSAAISQMAALLSLSTPEIKNNVKVEVEKTKQKRDIVINRIHQIGKGLSVIEPNGCVYLYVKYQKMIPSYDLCKDIIEKEGVIVSPGIGNGKGGEGHFCITFADSPEIIQEGMDRLQKYFNKYY